MIALHIHDLVDGLRVGGSSISSPWRVSLLRRRIEFYCPYRPLSLPLLLHIEGEDGCRFYVWMLAYLKKESYPSRGPGLRANGEFSHKSIGERWVRVMRSGVVQRNKYCFFLNGIPTASACGLKSEYSTTTVNRAYL